VLRTLLAIPGRSRSGLGLMAWPVAQARLARAWIYRLHILEKSWWLQVTWQKAMHTSSC